MPAHAALCEAAPNAGPLSALLAASTYPPHALTAALDAAAAKGPLRSAELLLEAGAQPSVVAVRFAAARGTTELLSLLLGHAEDPRRLADGDGAPRGPLWQALCAATPRLRAVDLLLEHGAVPRALDMSVAAGCDAPGLLRRLLDAGGSATEGPAPDRRPLVVATRMARLDNMRLLLALPDAPPPDNAVFVAAATRADQRALQLLLATTTTLPPLSPEHKSPMAAAARFACEANLRLLVAHGAVGGVDEVCAAASCASRCGAMLDLVLAAVAPGTDLEAAGREGRTPLQAAARAGQLAAVRRLTGPALDVRVDVRAAELGAPFPPVLEHLLPRLPADADLAGALDRAVAAHAVDSVLLLVKRGCELLPRHAVELATVGAVGRVHTSVLFHGSRWLAARAEGPSALHLAIRRRLGRAALLQLADNGAALSAEDALSLAGDGLAEPVAKLRRRPRGRWRGPVAPKPTPHIVSVGLGGQPELLLQPWRPEQVKLVCQSSSVTAGELRRLRASLAAALLARVRLRECRETSVARMVVGLPREAARLVAYLL